MSETGSKQPALADGPLKTSPHLYYGILSKTVSYTVNSCLCQKMQSSIVKTYAYHSENNKESYIKVVTLPILKTEDFSVTIFSSKDLINQSNLAFVKRH